MCRLRHCLSWGLAIAAVLLSPIVLIFALPLTIGAGFDIFAHAGEGPVAAALCGPVALVLLVRILARMPVRQAVAALIPERPHLGPPARLH